MVWDYDSFVQKVWEARKRQDPSGWFLEPPAAYFFGASWAALEARLPDAWKALLRAHRERYPEPFREAEAMARGAVLVVFRPEEVLLVPVVAPFLDALPEPPRALNPGPAPAGYPLAKPRLLPPLVLDREPPGDELPVHRHWLAAHLAAFGYTTCLKLPDLVVANVFDPGAEAEARLKRLVFLQAMHATWLDPKLHETNRCLVEGLLRFRSRLLALPATQGPYYLIPMRTGLLFIAQGGNALPVLLGGKEDFRTLLVRSVPPGWGEVLGLLPLDAAGRPLEDPIAWAEGLVQRGVLHPDDLAAWVAKARQEAKSTGRGGALVVGKRVTGFVASPVMWRRMQ